MQGPVRQLGFDAARIPNRFLSDLPVDAIDAFQALQAVTPLPRGTALFREGMPGRGVYVLCSGRAKISVSSESGRRLTLRVAGPGEILGLSATLTSSPYGATAELLEDGEVALVKRKDLLRFLREHREACLQVVQLLSEDLHVAYDRVRAIGLGRSRKSKPAHKQN